MLARITLCKSQNFLVPCSTMSTFAKIQVEHAGVWVEGEARARRSEVAKFGTPLQIKRKKLQEICKQFEY